LTALEGITVVDTSGTVATGYCGKLFADHGARVVNLEPREGFGTRALPPFMPALSPPENSALHAYLSTNKASVVRDEAALDVLCRGADVLLAAPPDEPARLARDYSNAIVCAISWFGLPGPYGDYRGSDAVVQSLAGLVKGIGNPEESPLLPTGFQAQIVGGLTAFIAGMTHVMARELGNRDEGALVDTSMLEANVCFTEVGAVGAVRSGYRGGRRGVNRFPPTYPLGIYPCRDGWLGVTTLTPAQWLSFCELLGLEDQANERRYLQVRERLRDADMLDPVIAAKVRDQSADELFNRGQTMRIPLAPVPTMAQLFETDQYVVREAFADLTLPGGEARVKAPVTPFRLFRTPAIAGGRVARLGEHDVGAVR